MSTNGSGIFGSPIGAIQKITGWAARKTTTRNSHGLNRSRYYVLAGDTLEKIADRSLGDPRFVGLLITINRPQVKMMGDGNARVPHIQPGQSIYLPTQEEMQVYRANFLQKPPTSETEQDVLKMPNEVWVESATAFDEESPAPQILPFESDATKVAVQFLEDSAVVPAKPKETESNTFEPPDLEHSIGALVHLSDCCRVQISESSTNQNEFNIRLEAKIMDSWRTIAAYYSREERIARVMYRIDGRRKQIDVQLPSSVVKEMAEEDFMHNWERHYRGYMMQKPSSIWLEFPAKTI
ncbi:MAG: 50S ribosomal protein L11 methyltransferase [Leptolyngbya sp.]|nr:50S ribosomal protein L11 methyltransferase [Candidatus Melainabacteria bacterium]